MGHFFRTRFGDKTMSYSDEPNLVAGRTRSGRRYLFIVAGFLLFFSLLAWVALHPKIHEYRRTRTEVGPHGGSLYTVKLNRKPFALELARSQEFDYHLWVFLEPTEEGTEWEPEDHSVGFGVERAEWENLAWDPEQGAFGPSTIRFHPLGDYQLTLEVRRGEERLWRGDRWSFRVEESPHVH